MRLLYLAWIVVALTLGFTEPVSATPKRPVIFIPGILGTRLCQGQDVLWGNALSLTNFERLKIPIEGTPPVVTTCGLVQKISLLGPFWAVHQYDKVITTLSDLGYRPGQSLFVFEYDWRKSNFDSARALQSFVERTPELRAGSFDIVAHSMGGIITRIYLQQFRGTERVHKVIYLGTPFAGSMNTLATLSDGWGTLINRVAGGIEAIRRTVLSFPAFYELFPRYTNCCRIGDERNYRQVDIFTPDNWLTYDWLPVDYTAGAGLQAFHANLKRAVALRDLLRSAPVNVPQIFVAGDAFSTSLYLYAPADAPNWRRWRFSKSRGDGTVPVWSAANNFTDLAGSLPSFSEHATIFDDSAARSILLRELVSNLPPEVSGSGAPLSLVTSAGVKAVRLIDVDVEPKAIAPGGSGHLVVRIDFAEPVDNAKFMPTAQLLGPSGVLSLTVSDTTTAAERSAYRFSFSAPITAPREVGGWRVDVSFPGQGVHATYFETWGPP